MANSGGGSSANVTVASILLLALVAIIVLVQAIRTLCSRSQDGEQRPDAGADPQAPKEQAAGPGLVACVYRRSDEWREATCPVCLSDFADGETVSVLPACMHYFHAACVGEWLCAHATCPLCHAAPATGGV